MQITTKPRRIKPAHLMCGQPIWGLAGVLSCSYLAYLSWGHVRQGDFDWAHDAWSIVTYAVWVLLMLGLLTETRCWRERAFFALVLANFSMGLGLVIWRMAPVGAVREVRLVSAWLWVIAALVSVVITVSPGGSMRVPFLPTKTALGSDVAKGNHFFYQIFSPFAPKEPLWAVRALNPDVTIVHVQRADCEGNAHCWGNFGVMIEGVRAAKRVIVVVEEIVDSEVIATDPNRTVIPGFLVNAVVECRYGAHPSPVQGYYKRDDAFFRQYHEQTKTKSDSDAWLDRWVYGLEDLAAYMNQLGGCRVKDLAVKNHWYAAATDVGC